MNSFVTNYNAVVKAVEEVDGNTVTGRAKRMVNDSATNFKSLLKVGITIGADNTLSIDEKAFKEADMRDVKNLFNGSHSLSAKAYQKAIEINNLSSSAASSTSLYNSKAGYVASYAGTLYNGSL